MVVYGPLFLNDKEQLYGKFVGYPLIISSALGTKQETS